MALQLAFNDVAPPGGLGLLYGLGYALGAGQRIFVPAFINSVFAHGVDRQILDGLLAFVVLAFLALLYNWQLRYPASMFIPS